MWACLTALARLSGPPREVVTGHGRSPAEQTRIQTATTDRPDQTKRTNIGRLDPDSWMSTTSRPDQTRTQGITTSSPEPNAGMTTTGREDPNGGVHHRQTRPRWGRLPPANQTRRGCRRPPLADQARMDEYHRQTRHRRRGELRWVIGASGYDQLRRHDDQLSCAVPSD